MEQEELKDKISILINAYYDLQKRYDRLVESLFWDAANMRAETNKILDTLIELDVFRYSKDGE